MGKKKTVKTAKKRHRKYEAQFKQKALRQIDNGKSIGSVAQSLGVSEALLYQWRKHRQTEAAGGKGDQISRLLKLNKQLEAKQKILKKALAHFRPLIKAKSVYELIDEKMIEKFPIQVICEALGVSRSAYYKYKKGDTYNPAEDSDY